MDGLRRRVEVDLPKAEVRINPATASARISPECLLEKIRLDGDYRLLKLPFRLGLSDGVGSEFNL